MKNKLLKILCVLILACSLYACKDEEIEQNETNETNETIKLVSDETKKVYLDNTTYHVYYYDKNGKITGYEQYVQYDYGVTASYRYSDIYEQYQQDENVEEIEAIGKYIKIKYKESKFNNMSLDSIKEDVSAYKEIY